MFRKFLTICSSAVLIQGVFSYDMTDQGRMLYGKGESLEEYCSFSFIGVKDPTEEKEQEKKKNIIYKNRKVIYDKYKNTVFNDNFSSWDENVFGTTAGGETKLKESFGIVQKLFEFLEYNEDNRISKSIAAAKKQNLTDAQKNGLGILEALLGKSLSNTFYSETNLSDIRWYMTNWEIEAWYAAFKEGLTKKEEVKEEIKEEPKTNLFESSSGSSEGAEGNGNIIPSISNEDCWLDFVPEMKLTEDEKTIDSLIWAYDKQKPVEDTISNALSTIKVQRKDLWNYKMSTEMSTFLNNKKLFNRKGTLMNESQKIIFSNFVQMEVFWRGINDAYSKICSQRNQGKTIKNWQNLFLESFSSLDDNELSIAEKLKIISYKISNLFSIQMTSQDLLEMFAMLNKSFTANWKNIKSMLEKKHKESAKAYKNDQVKFFNNFVKDEILGSYTQPVKEQILDILGEKKYKSSQPSLEDFAFSSYHPIIEQIVEFCKNNLEAAQAIFQNSFHITTIDKTKVGGEVSVYNFSSQKEHLKIVYISINSSYENTEDEAEYLNKMIAAVNKSLQETLKIDSNSEFILVFNNVSGKNDKNIDTIKDFLFSALQNAMLDQGKNVVKGKEKKWKLSKSASKTTTMKDNTKDCFKIKLDIFSKNLFSISEDDLLPVDEGDMSQLLLFKLERNVFIRLN